MSDEAELATGAWQSMRSLVLSLTTSGRLR